MSYFLTNLDIDRHNEQTKLVWDAYHADKPIRVPVVVAANPRIILLNPELNEEGVSFRDYFENPDIMARIQMRHLHYVRHNILQDAEMGLPREGWNLNVDLQNVYEAAWLGAPVEFRDGQVPDTRPVLTDDRKRTLFDRGLPDPFGDGLMETNWRFYEHIRANLAGYEYAGKPAISVTPTGLGTDGPFTVAANLRGATELCTDIYEAPDYVRELLGYLTQAIVGRIKAFRGVLGHEMRPQRWGFADDCIELISVETYREMVLPFHKKLLSELAGDGPHWIHLCGNVDRHLPVLQKELNVQSWDSGYPVDYGGVRSALGPDFTIQGGPRVGTLLTGSPEDVDAECKIILESGIMEGGRFVLREANNLSPRTPVENLAAMHAAAAKYGTYHS